MLTKEEASPSLNQVFLMQELPPQSRPRERLAEYGPQALADHELLAILIRTGSKNKNALDLALEVMTRFENLHRLKQASLEELMEIPGIGKVKAVEILAAIELGLRINRSPQIKEGKIASSKATGEMLLNEMRHLEQEHVVAIYLNTKNEIIKRETVFVGSLNTSIAHPREIFKGAVRYSAARIVLAHNHPSGNPEPSQADYAFTKRMVESGEMMGIELLDHFIIGEDSYVSLREEGWV